MSSAAESLLRQHIGQRITVLGRWESRGKLSGYIYGGAEPRLPIIYVKAVDEHGIERQNELERIASGTPVEVTGVLRFYQSPPSRPDDEISARPPDHFYFDADQASVKILGSSEAHQ